MKINYIEARERVKLKKFQNPSYTHKCIKNEAHERVKLKKLQYPMESENLRK